MTAAVTTGKWPSGLYADMPACVAARRVLRRRLRAVVEHMRPAAEQSEQDAEHVHQLRVATRRAAAALRIFRDFCPQGPHRELRRALKRLRRAAARARQDDVHAAQFAALPLPSTPAAPEAQALLLASIAESRRKAQ
ncbi:MAG TPA: CHAD domain-containing protein, partial [Phycisphaerae bacterium]|nr:CHAD domain-containing protein [Phycisphaerae bacterium]